MKKIGILTFHRSINYGAFMQSFSLAQQLIRRYGRIVEVIDFEKLTKHNAYHAKQGLFKILVYGQGRDIMRGRFQDDLNLLPLSDRSLITDDYGQVLKYIEGRYDIVIVGSDAVWAYNKGLGLKNPYWLFGNSLQCDKYSFAASAFSLDQSKLSDDEKDYIGDCLKSFSYIGVRDQETENLVKMCLPQAKVFRNCDPTVLLDKPNEEQANKVFEKFHLNPQKKLVTIMMGLHEPIIYDVLRKLGHDDFQFVYLYRRMKARERFSPWAPRFLYDLSPYEWYLLFRKSFLNLTSYFHGTLLALKSETPTISFDTCPIEGVYLSKIKQLMLDFGLDGFYNDYRVGINRESILSQIDFVLSNHEKIRKQIARNMLKEAQKSESFFYRLDKSVHTL